MKKFITITLLGIGFLFLACQEETGILSPESNNTLSQSQNGEPNWFSLPLSTDPKLYKSFEKSMLIDGSEKGIIKIVEEYPADTPAGSIKIRAELEFHAGSFEGTRLITMSVNDQFGEAKFSPSGTFLRPAKYSFRIDGIDLTGINTEDITFVYLTENGTYRESKDNDLKIDVSNSRIELKDALLPHFSRFGFVN